VSADGAICISNYARQATQSRLESVFVDLGAGFSRVSLHTDLAGERANNDLHGLYIASNGAHTDIDLKISHLAPDCRSRQTFKGIAGGVKCSTWNNKQSEKQSDPDQAGDISATAAAVPASRWDNVPASSELAPKIAFQGSIGAFSGKIYVAPDAQKTDAALHNRNLQLSESAKIYTRPQLEIYADDVKCGHGASVGQLDQEAIYYMRQRGMGEAEARRMQTQGFADDIINRCHSGAYRDFVAAAAEKLISDF
jgi:Fe-S cluster assembly protein SufD